MEDMLTSAIKLGQLLLWWIFKVIKTDDALSSFVFFILWVEGSTHRIFQVVSDIHADEAVLSGSIHLETCNDAH